MTTSPVLRPFVLLSLCLSLGLVSACGPKPSVPVDAAAPVKVALTVELVQAKLTSLPQYLAATGSVAPWREVSISAEVPGLRLTEVRVNEGDTVRKGQVLAVLNAQDLQAEMAGLQAALAEAQANLTQASASLARATQLAGTEALSGQEAAQFEALHAIALARVAAAQARVTAQTLKLSYTTITAPTAGVISAKKAVAGAMAPGGVELFRLIAQGRLEWRAEVPGNSLRQVSATQRVALDPPAGPLTGARVRQISATVDTASRMGTVYVDLPSSSGLKSGMYIGGRIELGQQETLVVPQSALVVRDGYTLAMKVGADQTVQPVRLKTGRLQGSLVEVLEGLTPADAIVARGAGFLKQGDRVLVVSASPVEGSAK